MKKSTTQKDGANRNKLFSIGVNVLTCGVLLFAGYDHIEQREVIEEAQTLIERQEEMIDYKDEKLSAGEAVQGKLKQAVVDADKTAQAVAKENDKLTKRMDAQMDVIEGVKADVAELEGQKRNLQAELEKERKKYKALLN